MSSEKLSDKALCTDKQGQTLVLKAAHLSNQFGGLKAVDDVNLSISQGELYGLIGPNGAGKTTVFNLLTKVYQPTRGTILLDGMDTAGKSTIQVIQMGIARTFQNIRLFRDLTVLDNVLIGLHNETKYSLATAMFRLPQRSRWFTASKAARLLSMVMSMTRLSGVRMSMKAQGMSMSPSCSR